MVLGLRGVANHATAKKTFIGQYTDSETSLSYLNARYYSPAQGQFLSEDSVFLGMGTNKGDLLLLLSDPQSQNSYGYARDNPISSSDPTGKSWWTGFRGIAAGAVTALAIGAVITAAITTLPFSATALTVMAVAGGLGTVAGLANSWIATDRAYASGAITADQRDYNRGSVVGSVAGGVAGGWIGTKIGSSISSAMSGAVATAETAAVHGNSLSSVAKNYGYTLRDRVTGEIMKFGETINPATRYSNKFYRENGVFMREEISGTKSEVHNWQHQRILEYKDENSGSRPALNKSDW